MRGFYSVIRNGANNNKSHRPIVAMDATIAPMPEWNWRVLPELTAGLAGLAAAMRLSRWGRERLPAKFHTWGLVAQIALAALLLCGIVLSLRALAGMRPIWPLAWVRAAAFAGSLYSLLLLPVIWYWRRRRPLPHNPGRRRLLLASRALLAGAPMAAAGFGVAIGRQQYQVKEIEIAFPHLPPDLHGLRLVQISDIHLSPFLSRADLARVVDMANETRAHLALVTGDLITFAKDPLDDCLAELTRLRADAGVFGCLGNHERYAKAEQYTVDQGARRGLRFLRQQAATLPFGAARLRLAGVDYQSLRAPYLEGAEQLREPGAFHLLLSHNPDVFPVAARKGFDLTLAGHTHGGQVNFEILEQQLNVARFYTPYTYGLYREDARAVYVTSGIGTVGVPMRLGAPPEVALIKLCAG